MTAALVGRTSELQAALAGLESAHALGCLIAGEAGIGKSSVWRAAVDAAGGRVLTARAREVEAPLPYATLDALLAPVADEILPQLPAPQARALEVVLLLADEDGAPPDERRVGAATLSAVRVLAAAGRLLVAIDDVQWVDAPSAAALEYAAARLTPAEPVRLLLAWRSGDAPARVAAGVAEAGLRRVDVGPMNANEIRELVLTRSTRALSRPQALRLHETVRGNPLHAIELARALSDEQLAGREPITADTDLAALIARRVAALPEPTRRALLLVAILAEPHSDHLDDVAATALAPAQADGLVEMQAGRIAFTHPLYAAALVASTPPAAVRAAHRELAATTTDPVVRARHLALGSNEPDPSVAGELDAAAELAAARGGTVTAAELAEHAARLTPAGDEEMRLQRRVTGARHAAVAGDVEHARRVLQEVLGDATGRTRARALLLLADALAGDLEESEALVQEALDAAGEDAGLRMDAWLTGSMIAGLRGDGRAGLERARRALAAAEESDDVALRATALGGALWNELLTWNFTPGLLERALALPEPRGVLLYHHPRMTLGMRLMFLDRYDEAREHLEAMRRLAQAEGDVFNEMYALYHLCELEVRAGRLDTALEMIRQEAVLGDQAGADLQPGSRLAARAYVCAHRGDAQARELGEQALAAAEAEGDWIFATLSRGVLSFVDLMEGDAAAAARRLRGIPDRIIEGGWDEPTVWRLWPDALESLIVTGEFDESERLTSHYEALAARTGAPTAVGTAARARAQLLAARGESAAAATTFERAAAAFGGANPLEHARTLLAAGVFHRRAKRKAEARGLLEAARDELTRIGAHGWRRVAEAELGRIGGRRPAGDELTPTERRVAELIAQGRSNKEAAAALYVTVRAVEANLTRIYAKLGVRTRTELAARMAEQTMWDPALSAPADRA